MKKPKPKNVSWTPKRHLRLISIPRVGVGPVEVRAGGVLGEALLDRLTLFTFVFQLDDDMLLQK